jgi:hypothetical protein
MDGVPGRLPLDTHRWKFGMAHHRMPHNNRVSSSVSLQTNDIWTKTIGHDPYSTGDDLIEKEQSDRAAGLLLLAKMSNLSGSETRGACSRCGMVGHLTFQCRNLPKSNVSDSENASSSEDEVIVEVSMITIISNIIYCR